MSRGLSDNRSVASSRTRSPGTASSFFSFSEGQGAAYLSFLVQSSMYISSNNVS